MMDKRLLNTRNAGLLFLLYYFIHISAAGKYSDEVWFKWMVLIVPVVFLLAGAVYAGCLLKREELKGKSRLLLYSMCIIGLVWLYEIYRFVL